MAVSTPLVTAPEPAPAAPRPTPPARLVRRKAPPLRVVPVTSPREVELHDGIVRQVRVGDLLIARDAHVLDVVTDATLTHLYEPIIEGTLTLTPADCAALDDVLGLGASRSPAALITAVVRLARIRIGDIRIPFTPGQLEEIAYRAQKRGRTVDQELQAVVDRIRDEIFHRGPVGAGA